MCVYIVIIEEGIQNRLTRVELFVGGIEKVMYVQSMKIRSAEEQAVNFGFLKGYLESVGISRFNFNNLGMNQIKISIQAGSIHTVLP